MSVGTTHLSSVAVISQSNSDSGTCSHWSTESSTPTVPEEIDVRGSILDCLLCYISSMMLLKLEVFYCIIWCCNLFYLNFRLQIKLQSQKQGPMPQVLMFHKAAVRVHIARIGPWYLLLNLIRHKEIWGMHSKRQLIYLGGKTKILMK